MILTEIRIEILIFIEISSFVLFLSQTFWLEILLARVLDWAGTPDLIGWLAWHPPGSLQPR